MSVEQNKANEKRLYDEVWNKGNYEVIHELVSPDYVTQTAQREFKGHQGYRDMVTLQRTNMPDLHFTIDEMVGEGDKLAYRITGHGTYKGKLGDVELTGKKFNWTQALFAEFKNGKVAKGVSTYDMLGIFRQAGVRPPGFDEPVERNKASMRRCFEEVWNKGNLAAIPEVIALDYVGYTPAATTRGLAAFEQSVMNQRTGMPDLHYAIDSVVGEADTLAIRLTLTGTFKGRMGNTESTGKSLNFKMALFNRYVDGKCVESTLVGNRLSANQQLGIAEPTG